MSSGSIPHTPLSSLQIPQTSQGKLLRDWLPSEVIDLKKAIRTFAGNRKDMNAGVLYPPFSPRPMPQ